MLQDAPAEEPAAGIVGDEGDALGETGPDQHDIHPIGRPAIVARMQQPRDMAAAVLGTTVAAVAEKLKHGHSSEKVPVKIPVYVAYFTAWPDQAGKVSYYADVYGRDQHLSDALEKTDAARAPQEIDETSSVPAAGKVEASAL